ncbi:MAG: heavy metal translocating P-type ATPase [Eubacteriales bacterium]|nr:heavy metal translocating P-type ATPase [Eubacteriales bacterium]MDD3880653.1 heavy metal translocating P-type ATPase [Eubacteriales bacterium]MDD4513558.1 heavy metal translocating P-type ATPase [Eubacteriales bacterium]
MEREQKETLLRIIISAVMFLFAFLAPVSETVKTVVYIASYLLIGGDIVIKAVKNIFHGEVFDECFLMTIATAGAIAIGEYPEACLVMLLYQIGELFQDIAVDKSRASVTALMDIRPDYANIEKDGELVRVAPGDVESGSVIVVKAGEKIPLDGVIVSGDSTLNTTALTGESLPRDVAAGDSVLSGCVNLSGLLRIRTTSVYGESTVSKIIELVENAETGKAKTEKFITRFAKVYTPIVVALAVLLTVVPSIFTGQWLLWLSRALIFLVISCPCALVISVPLGFFGGIGGASRRGILIKGSNYLEALANTDTVVFDKTGTLTKGNFAVSAVHESGMGEHDLIEIAALAESYSDHPISQSLRAAYNRAIDKSRITGVEDISGRGIRAIVDGKTVLAGNSKLMDENGIAWKQCHREGTMIHIAIGGVYAGHIVISDEVKPESKQAVAALYAAGVTKTVMLTGDRKSVAESVAAELGITETHSELLPADKVMRVEGLLKAEQDGGKLAFVGDGINDAPVLKRADVGIAMGALGSDAAIDASDVVLMDDDPRKIALAIKLSRRTLAIVKQNIVFALAVKAAMLVLGAMGIASMWAAVFADVGVSFLAILNSLRAMNAGDK